MARYRTKGTGSISYDKTRGKWIGSFVDPFTNKRVKKRFLTKKEAQQFISNNTNAILNDDYINCELTFGQWMVQYFSTYKHNLKQSTLLSYTTKIKVFAPIYNIKLKDLKPIVLQNIINEIDLSPNTKRTTLTILKTLLNKAVKIGIMRSNPAKSVELESYKKKTMQVFSNDELKNILNYYKPNSLTYTMIYLLASTGMRIGEAIALKWENIDLKNKIIKITSTAFYNFQDREYIITEPKTNNSLRTINIGEKLAKVLTEYKSNKKIIDINGFVFVEKNNKVIVYHTFYNRWKKALSELNIPYRKIHALRHTHATMLLANNIPITEVANRIGDTIDIMLKNYAHAIPNKGKEIAEISEQIQNF